MTASKTMSRTEAQSYKPSWIDRLTNWVEKLGIGEWVFYILSGIALILVQMLILWLDGGLGALELLPVIIFNGLLTPFILGLIHFLDKQAATALNSMRPTLDLSEPEINRYEYRLTNMPFLAPLIAGLAMLAFVLLMEQVSTLPVRYSALERLPLFAVIYHIVDKSSAFLFGVVIYHTIRQLRLVNKINTNHIRINLFHLGPVQAFSRLTASTAVVLLFGIYGWMLINPDLLSDPLTMGFVVVFTFLAFVVFAWPLVGAYRLMQMEKRRMLHEIDLRFETLFATFNQHLQEGDYDAIEPLNGTISSLEIQHRKIVAIPTWPWRPETARSVLTAIAIPLVIWFLQFFLERALNQ